MIGTSYPDKDLATARAMAALQCIALERIENDRGVEEFVATRGPLTRQFDCLASFNSWLVRVEARTE